MQLQASLGVVACAKGCVLKCTSLLPEMVVMRK